MGTTDGDDVAELNKRAEQLRTCARDARKIAGRLGPYLDDVVKKATPRAVNLAGDTGEAIWLGPFADQCTRTLQDRKGRLSGLASALMADANRWESQARSLDDQAQAKGTTGGR